MARPRSDIEPRIVAAARGRFLEEGVDGASLRQIASDAKTSIGMVYYYFPTKDDLFLEVVEETYGKLLADMTRALGTDVPVKERIRRLYARVGAISDEELSTVRLVLREMLVSSSRCERLLVRFQNGHLPLVIATLTEGVHDEILRDDLPPVLLLLCTLALGAVPQLLQRALQGRGPLAALPPGDALGDRLVDVLFSGLGAKKLRAKVKRTPAK